MGKEQELLDAARSGNVALIEKILSQRKWTAGPLALPLPALQIRKGAHPNCQDTNGETPLHHASLNGHKEVVELLLKLQASANIPDVRGCFPLHLSAWRGNADVCRVLLSHGPSLAKVNAQNLEGDTALHSAAQYGHNQVVDLLLQNRADPLIKNTKGERALDLAIQYGRLETVQLLLQAAKGKGLDLASEDKPPLLLAAKSGHKPVLQILLDAGFDINQKTTNGTVLHEACMYGRLEIVKLLLEKGINVDVKDSEGKTAVDLLNDLNTPISLEINKAINDHINPQTEASNARLSVSSELDYDYLPGSRPTKDGDGARIRLLSQDSSDSFASQQTATDQEESIYDHPRAFQSKLNKVGGLSSSFRNDLPPKSPDTPKKPPRKRPPVQSVMVKGNIIPDKKESSDGSSADPASTATQNKESLTCVATNTSNSDSTDIPCNKTDNELPSVATKATDNEHVNNNKANCADNNNELTTFHVNDNSVGATKNSDASKNPVYATNQLPVNARPPTLNLNGKRSSLSTDIPLSPSTYEQPPTPEHPPPSPMTAVLGIQEKINPKERRRSRDMETITETEYLAAMTASAAAESSSAVETSMPSRPCPSSEGCDVAVVASRNPYHGLTMGSSLASGQRRVKSQILDNVYGQGLKRISVPAGLMAFDPVIERAEEQESALTTTTTTNPAQAGSRTVPEDQSKRMSQQPPRTKLSFLMESKEKIASPDETEEWAKIEDLITSIGGGLDTDMLVKEFDERMSSVLLATGGLRVLSVGDWLESLDLPQYENLLVANGFDDMDFLGSDVLEEIDLEEIGIADKSHRQRILEGASKFPPIKPFSDSQHSVREWLESIRLLEYLDTLIKHGFHDLERIKKLWEVELTSILDITMLGHRKRILASLKHFAEAERRSHCANSALSKTLGEQRLQGQTDTDFDPPFRWSLCKDLEQVLHEQLLCAVDVLSYGALMDGGPLSRDLEENAQLLHDLTPSQELEQVSLYKDYTNITSLTRVTKRPTVSDLDEIEKKTESVEAAKGREKAGDEREGSETLEASVSHWCHRPEALVKGCCNYNVQYLGSTLVTLLDGTESTKASISKFKRSTEHIAKVPNIILSISYRGVKFIDAKSKKVICEHEIGNIFCACQDGDSLNFFAYITRDLVTDKHYCHVFTVDSTSLATEIILTLGEAFEVAYQIAVTERSHQAQDSIPELHGPEDDSNAVHNTDADDSLETLPGAARSNCYSTAI